MARYRSYVGAAVFLWGVGLAPAASAANRAPTRGYAVCGAREMVALADGSLSPNACRASGFSDPDREPGVVFVKSTDCPAGAVALSGGSLSASAGAITADCSVQLGVSDAAGLEPTGDLGLSATVSVRSYSARLLASAPRVNATQEGTPLQIPISLKSVNGRARTAAPIDGAQSIISVTKDGIDVMATAAGKFSFGEDKKLTFTPGSDDSGRWEVVARSESGAGHADAAIAVVVKDMNPPNYIAVSRPRPGEELPAGAASYMARGHCDAVGEPVTVQLGGATATTTCRAGGVWSAKVALGAEGDKSLTAGYAEGADVTGAAAAARSFRKGAAGGGSSRGGSSDGSGGVPTFQILNHYEASPWGYRVDWSVTNGAGLYIKVYLVSDGVQELWVTQGPINDGSSGSFFNNVQNGQVIRLELTNSDQTSFFPLISSDIVVSLPGGGGGGGASATPSITSASGTNAESDFHEISWAGTNLGGKYITLEQQDSSGTFMKVAMLGDAAAGIAAVEYSLLTDGRILRLKVWNNDTYTSTDGVVSPEWLYTAPSPFLVYPMLDFISAGYFTDTNKLAVSWTDLPWLPSDQIMLMKSVDGAVTYNLGPANTGYAEIYPPQPVDTSLSYEFEVVDQNGLPIGTNYSSFGVTLQTSGGEGGSSAPTIILVEAPYVEDVYGNGEYSISWRGTNVVNEFLALEQYNPSTLDYQRIGSLGVAGAGAGSVAFASVVPGMELRLRLYTDDTYTTPVSPDVTSRTWLPETDFGGDYSISAFNYTEGDENFTVYLTTATVPGYSLVIQRGMSYDSSGSSTIAQYSTGLDDPEGVPAVVMLAVPAAYLGNTGQSLRMGDPLVAYILNRHGFPMHSFAVPIYERGTGGDSGSGGGDSGGPSGGGVTYSFGTPQVFIWGPFGYPDTYDYQFSAPASDLPVGSTVVLVRDNDSTVIWTTGSFFADGFISANIQSLDVGTSYHLEARDAQGNEVARSTSFVPLN